MSAQDDLSSMSSISPSDTSIVNKIVKVVVLSNKSYKCDQLDGRSPEATQLELASDRKKHRGYCTLEKEYTFVFLLESLRMKSRCMPTCQGLCTCLVDSDEPTLVENNANVLQYVMLSSGTTTPNMHYALATCKVTVSNMPDDKNAMAMLMKTQIETKISSCLCSFYKKVTPGHDK